MADAENRKAQVALQCKAVAHMARAIADIYGDYERMFSSEVPSPIDDLVDQIGRHTALWMEDFGDKLNGIDAVTEDDDWMKSVFKEAQRLWLRP